MSWRLYADLGNATLHWGVFPDTDSRDAECLAHDRISALPEEFGQSCVSSLNTMLDQAGETLADYAGGLLCTSNPALTPDFVRGLERSTGIRLPELTSAMTAHIRTSYHDRTQLGLDRLANTAAVLAHYKYPAVVADLGTCITVDLINAKGVLVGGAIAPGLPIMFVGIAAQTPHLVPALDRMEPPANLTKPGRSTEECLALGIYSTLLGTTLSLCAQLSFELPSTSTILTGGDAICVQSMSNFGDVFDEILTLKGLQALDLRH